MEMSGRLHAPATLSPGTHWIGSRVDHRASTDDSAAKALHKEVSEDMHEKMELYKIISFFTKSSATP